MKRKLEVTETQPIPSISDAAALQIDEQESDDDLICPDAPMKPRVRRVAIHDINVALELLRRELFCLAEKELNPDFVHLPQFARKIVMNAVVEAHMDLSHNEDEDECFTCFNLCHCHETQSAIPKSHVQCTVRTEDGLVCKGVMHAMEQRTMSAPVTLSAKRRLQF